MLSLFRHKRRKLPPPPTVNITEGYLPIESARSLLAAEHRASCPMGQGPIL
jgi:hypothetical protein